MHALRVIDEFLTNNIIEHMFGILRDLAFIRVKQN